MTARKVDDAQPSMCKDGSLVRMKPRAVGASIADEVAHGDSTRAVVRAESVSGDDSCDATHGFFAAGSGDLGLVIQPPLAPSARSLSLRQRDLRALVVDAVVSRIGAGVVGARVVFEVVRAAPPCGQCRLGAGGNHNSEAALLAGERAIEVVGAIAEGDFHRTEVVQNLGVGPGVGERAVRDGVAAPRDRVWRNRYL